MTNIRRAVPVTVASSVPAVTWIFVFPNPTTKSFRVTSSPAARTSMVPAFSLPTKISFPSSDTLQSISVRSDAPVFLMVAETPRPPLMVIVTAIGCSMVKVLVFSSSQMIRGCCYG
jgi:hypothetical protein